MAGPTPLVLAPVMSTLTESVALPVAVGLQTGFLAVGAGVALTLSAATEGLASVGQVLRSLGFG
jgi:hypothetical protein